MTSHDPLTLEARINQQAQQIRLLREDVDRLLRKAKPDPYTLRGKKEPRSLTVIRKGKEAKGE